MVYKKYINRGGKIFGPYYCESYRDNKGKVRTRMVSKPKRSLSFWNIFLIFLGILVLSSLLFISFNLPEGFSSFSGSNNQSLVSMVGNFFFNFLGKLSLTGNVILGEDLNVSLTLNTTNPLNNDTYQNLEGYTDYNYSGGNNITWRYNWYKDDELNATTLITDGLVAYFPLDNDTYDYWRSNDGTNNGASQNNSGKVAGTYSFDGVGNYINVSHSSDLNLTSEITLSVWIYLNSNQSQYTKVIAKDKEIAGEYPYQLSFDGTDDKIYFKIYNGVTYGIVSTPAGGAKNEWIHIVGTSNGTELKLYFNNVLVHNITSPVMFNLQTNSEDLVIGGREIGPYFNGSLDEIMIFNRSLNASEVSQLYYGSAYGGNTLNSSRTSPGDFWKLGARVGDYLDWSDETNSSSVEILGNVAPVIESVTLETTDPETNDTNQSLIGTLEALDFNGDNMAYIYNWYKDDELNATTLITDGLVAYFPLDNDTYDYWRSNDGTNNGASQNNSGKVAGTYSFDGVGNYISVSHSSDLNLTSEITLSVWIYLNSNQSQYTKVIAKDKEIAGEYPYQLSFDGIDDKIYFKIYNGTNYGVVSSPAGGAKNEWIHIVGTSNGTDLNLYSNGILTDNFSSSFISEFYTNSEDLVIGGRETEFYFNGSLDEIMIFNRSLNASEVSQLYYGSAYGGNTLNSSRTSPGDFWKLGARVGDYLDWSDETNSSSLMVFTEPIIHSLQNASAGRNFLYWKWTNPIHNFSEAVVYFDGVNVINTTDSYYVASNLDNNTEHNISVYTKFTNDTVETSGVHNVFSTVNSLCYGDSCLEKFVIPVGLSYSLLSNDDQINLSIYNMNLLGVNFTRTDLHWRLVEPTRGSFNWDNLDSKINNLSDNNIDLLLTFVANAADWACIEDDNDDFCIFKNDSIYRNFLEEFFTRYPDKVHRIQFSNEWSLSTNFNGTKEEYVNYLNILYNVTKELSPSTLVSPGGILRSRMAFLLWCEDASTKNYLNSSYTQEQIDALCNSDAYEDVKEFMLYVFENANYDEIDIHLYDDAENWGDYLDKLDSLVDVPIFVSEFGGPHPVIEPYSESYQFEKTKFYLKVLNDLNITSAYFFKFVETDDTYHSTSALVSSSPELRAKPIYYLIQEYNNYYPLDIIAPEINVVSPTSTTYTTSTVWFNASSNEAIDTWIVNYNGTNHTLSAINTSLNVEDGAHNLLLYGNDSFGNFGLNNSISFSVDTSTPPPPPSCFPEYTLITMADKTQKQIKYVKFGDEVLSYDLETNEFKTARVLELEFPIREGVYEINNLINVTNEHPFYVLKNNSLVWAAIDKEVSKEDLKNSNLANKEIYSLEKGDYLFNANKSLDKINSIKYYAGEIQTYNLKVVDKYNVFFANNLLVHNKGGGGGGCTDECEDGEQEKECSDDSTIKTRTCGNYDTDSCLEWSDWEYESCDNNEICYNCECITECVEDWECQWSVCTSGDDYSYAYDCVDVNDCGTEFDKPDKKACDKEKESKDKESPSKPGCKSNWNCSDWGICEISYTSDDLIKGNIPKGVKKRTCVDLNACHKDIVEKSPCVAFIPIRAEKTTYCYENYINLFEKTTGRFIGRIKESETQFADINRLDIFFTSEQTYCDYCFDGIKNYDETGLDCGGESCPPCIQTYGFFNWLFWLNLILWSLCLILSLTLIYLMRKKIKEFFIAWRKESEKTKEIQIPYEREITKKILSLPKKPASISGLKKKVLLEHVSQSLKNREKARKAVKPELKRKLFREKKVKELPEIKKVKKIFKEDGEKTFRNIGSAKRGLKKRV